MRIYFLLLALLLSVSCGAAPQPKSAQSVAAFEVPLFTKEERAEFLALLDREANAEGLHLDYSTDEELDLLKTDIVEMTVHAAIWRDRNDDKLEVSIMDQKDHLGLIWIVFARGENEKLATRFRNNVTRAIKARWPDTLTLPIMPTGAIPVHRDLIKVSEGYIVNPAAAARYQVQEGESKRAPEAP